MTRWTVTDPEMESVEEFAQYLMDDERSSYTGPELQVLARATKQDVDTVRTELESYGFHQVGRAPSTGHASAYAS